MNETHTLDVSRLAPGAFGYRSILWWGTAGFVVIDMQDVFQDSARDDLILNNSDYHPNAAGHRIIADRLYSELMAHPEVLAAER